jgi:hypothetical protein
MAVGFHLRGAALVGTSRGDLYHWCASSVTLYGIGWNPENGIMPGDRILFAILSF